MSKFLKNFWKGFVAFHIRIGRARAAAELTRMGYYEEAKRVMLAE